MTFESVAAELLRAPLEEFVALRREAAKDPALKDRLARLPKPTVAAWALNAYAHEHPRELGGLLDTGAAMREAQAAGDAARLRALTVAAGGRVRELVTAIAHGRGEAVQAQVEQTLRAAMSDPAAADAVQAGLLLKPLAPAGFGAVDLAGSVAGSPPARPTRPVLTVVPDTGKPVRRQPAAAVEPARTRLKEARRALTAAEAELTTSERRHASAQHQRERAAEALAAADADLREATTRLTKARRTKEAAEGAVAKARAALATAQGQSGDTAPS